MASVILIFGHILLVCILLYFLKKIIGINYFHTVYYDWSFFLFNSSQVPPTQQTLHLFL